MWTQNKGSPVRSIPRIITNLEAYAQIAELEHSTCTSTPTISTSTSTPTSTRTTSTPHPQRHAIPGTASRARPPPRLCILHHFRPTWLLNASQNAFARKQRQCGLSAPVGNAQLNDREQGQSPHGERMPKKARDSCTGCGLDMSCQQGVYHT